VNLSGRAFYDGAQGGDMGLRRTFIREFSLWWWRRNRSSMSAPPPLRRRRRAGRAYSFEARR
jgi:hypothetical protein